MPTRTVPVRSATGLHARPAATFAAAAAATGVDVTVTTSGGDRADAASLLEVMVLGVGHGDVVTLSAEGPGADAALDGLAGLLATDLDA
ncbi:hypothetical protein NUM3379_19080 [Kineococcus sp. NUM-3379]